MEETKTNSVQDNSQRNIKQIVVFKLGQEEYGLHIDQIKEVVITPNVTRMPQTPSFIRGVANVRGNVIAVLDLEERFGIDKHNARSEHNFTLVIESDDYKMGILVREVPNTLSISASSIEEFVSTGDHQSQQSCIAGIVKLDKRLIIMIDIFKVVNEQEAQQLLKKQSRQTLQA